MDGLLKYENLMINNQQKFSVQILCFSTLSIFLSLFKNCPVYFSKHNVSETVFSLRRQARQVALALLTGSNWVRFTWRLRQNLISETLCSEKQTGRFLGEDKTVNNVQKHNICTSVP
jgi:hypothetical protein